MENVNAHFTSEDRDHAPLVLVSALALGQNVERLRLQAKLSKTKLCMMAQITRPTLNKIESGTSNVKLQYVEQLAVALGTTPWELITPQGGNGKELMERLYLE